VTLFENYLQREIDAQGGASVAGASRVLGPFPFAFDDVGLVDGVTFYTPAVGDVLLDAWFEVPVAWDGTTPFADIGTSFPNGYGMFGQLNGPVLLGDANFNQNSLQSSSHLDNLGSANILITNVPSSARQVPASFLDDTPLKVVVSQTGQPGGADPGAAQGSGVIYLVVATPSIT
jgi:hypothetical protein